MWGGGGGWAKQRKRLLFAGLRRLFARVFTAFLFLSQNKPPRQYRLRINTYNISELVVGFASLLFST